MTGYRIKAAGKGWDYMKMRSLNEVFRLRPVKSVKQ